MLKNNVNSENVDVKALCVKAECINCSNGSLAIFMTVRNKEGECTAKLWSAPSSDVSQYIDKLRFFLILRLRSLYRGLTWIICVKSL